MENPFHYITVRTFCYPTELKDRVRKAISFIAFGGDGEAEKIEESVIEGSFGDIVVMEARIERAKDIRDFCRRVFPLVDADDAVRDVDGNLFFHLKFGKEGAAEGKVVFAHDGNIIHMKGKIRAYPSSRENALGVISEAVREYHNN